MKSSMTLKNKLERRKLSKIQQSQRGYFQKVKSKDNNFKYHIKERGYYFDLILNKK